MHVAPPTLIEVSDREAGNKMGELSQPEDVRVGTRLSVAGAVKLGESLHKKIPPGLQVVRDSFQDRPVKVTKGDDKSDPALRETLHLEIAPEPMSLRFGLTGPHKVTLRKLATHIQSLRQTVAGDNPEAVAGECHRIASAPAPKVESIAPAQVRKELKHECIRVP